MDYPEKVSQIISRLSEIKAFHEYLQEFSQSNNQGRNDLGINLYGKLVLKDEETNGVYRIEQDDEILKRIKLRGLAQSYGFGTLFTEEEIVEDFGFFMVSKQPLLLPLKVDGFDIENESLDHLAPKSLVGRKITWKIFQDHKEKKDQIIEFFNDFKIGWFGDRNCGMTEDGKISIYDYTGRFSLTGDKTKFIYYKEGKQYEIDVSKL